LALPAVRRVESHLLPKNDAEELVDYAAAASYELFDGVEHVDVRVGAGINLLPVLAWAEAPDYAPACGVVEEHEAWARNH
jgi:hypothetical protein